MLKLVKSELRPMTDQRLVRMLKDTLALRAMSKSEMRAAYDKLEVIRDELSRLLDTVDGKT